MKRPPFGMWTSILHEGRQTEMVPRVKPEPVKVFLQEHIRGINKIYEIKQQLKAAEQSLAFSAAYSIVLRMNTQVVLVLVAI